jgi:ATP-dependent Clp protease ATP-binding subunit ClpA
MFERFTDQARAAVTAAQKEARELGHNYIGTEHLLLALLRDGSQPAAQVLAGLGVRREQVRDDLVAIVGSGRRQGIDEAALRAIGIDLDAVRRKIEAAFGPGALDIPPPRARRWPSRRRPPARQCDHRNAGHIPFTPRAKKVLELSLREALRLHDREIRTEHILLGLLREGHGLAVQLLARQGADPDRVRVQVMTKIRRIA